MISPEKISEAFTALREAKLALYEVGEKSIAAKLDLEEKKKALLMGNTINGKNAEIREAQLAQGCWQEMAALEMAESEKRKAAHDVDIAALVVDELKWIIRSEMLS